MKHQTHTDYIDTQEEEIISNLCQFIEIPSVSSDLIAVKESLDYILSLGKAMGMRSRSLMNNQIGIVEIGQGDETIGILVHVDVVPAGDLDLWQTPPFKATIIDGRIYGRGAIDDKGPAIAALYAMKAIDNIKKPLKKKIQLIIGTQEEVEWTDMQAYTKAYPLPDYGFTPDGEFPLCNIEKGFANIELELPLSPNNEAIFSTQDYLTELEGGTQINVVPANCKAKAIKNGQPLDHHAMGRATHSSQPENGDNAIVKLCKNLNPQDYADNGVRRAVHMIATKLDEMDGRHLGLKTHHQYYNGEFIHHNTLSVTTVKTEEDAVRIGVNMRHTYGTHEENIQSAFDELAKAYGGKISYFRSMPPVYISKDQPFMKVFETAYNNISGRDNVFSLAYGGSYAKAMPNIVSWGPLFPDEEDTCHEANEFININNLMCITKIYTDALVQMAFTSQSFKL